jgi:hypothetical protein
MAQLTVDVSMLEALMQEGGSPSPRGQPSCPRAWAMPMVTDGDLTGEVGWGAVGVAPPVAAAVPASVRVLQQARAIATRLRARDSGLSCRSRWLAWIWCRLLGKGVSSLACRWRRS